VDGAVLFAYIGGDSAIYKNSMDYVRLNELNGYHLNEWTIEDLDKSAKFGLPALDNPDDLICGGMVDEDGFMAGAFLLDDGRLAARNGYHLHIFVSQ